MEWQTTRRNQIKYGQVKSSAGWVAVGKIKNHRKDHIWLVSASCYWQFIFLSFPTRNIKLV
jgi:hypothetical protein